MGERAGGCIILYMRTCYIEALHRDGFQAPRTKRPRN